MKYSALVVITTAVIISSSANAALLGRDLDGNLATAEAYYDDSTNLTWLADANYAKTSGYIDTINTSFNNGTMTWDQSKNWAAGLNFNGVNNWRIADAGPIDGSTANDAINKSYIGTEDIGVNISAPGTLYAESKVNELAYLFYNTLGNEGLCDVSLSTESSCSPLWDAIGANSITGPFTNVEHTGSNLNGYWTSADFLPNPDTSSVEALYFNFGTGAQDREMKSNVMFAWAVHAGDVGVEVSAVPVPAAVWLFTSGLIGLTGLARKKSKR